MDGNGSGHGSWVGRGPPFALAGAPACGACGFPTVPNGACRRCLNCGETTGCS